jgi:hypothetical protein
MPLIPEGGRSSERHHAVIEGGAGLTPIDQQSCKAQPQLYAQVARSEELPLI